VARDSLIPQGTPPRRAVKETDPSFHEKEFDMSTTNATVMYEHFERTTDGKGPDQSIFEVPLEFPTLKVQSLFHYPGDYDHMTFHVAVEDIVPANFILLWSNTKGGMFIFNVPASRVSFMFHIQKTIITGKALEAIFFDVNGKEVGRVKRDFQTQAYNGTIESPASATKLASVQIISSGNTNAVYEFAMTL